MYTASYKKETINKKERSRFVTATITDGTDTFDETLRFHLSVPQIEIKKAFKQLLDELNVEPEEITGNITEYTKPVQEGPSADEVAQQAWLDSYQNLKAAVALEAVGVTVATPTQLAALRKKVQDDFKREYAGFINSI